MTKGHKETLEGVVFVHYLDCGDGLTGVYICHLIKLYTLYVGSLLYIDFTSTKQKFFNVPFTRQVRK